jgi:PhzF family phenazine biosynthesis protein
VHRSRAFTTVDVFTAEPYVGNPVAVILEADDLSTDEMQRVARWTNLSETTFVLAPTDRLADYRVRIFTPVQELPFAGHPTIGTCHAWLAAGGEPSTDDRVVQECGVGLVTVARSGGRLAFAAPPLRRSGPADTATVDEVCRALGLDAGRLVAVEWVDNGPGWVAALVDSVDTVLGIRPGTSSLDIGVAAFTPQGSPYALEVRAFFPKDGVLAEDPVTGSLNASLAQWLLSSGRLTSPYLAHQGTVLGRAGRVHVEARDGDVWVGGDAVTCVRGTIAL